MSTLSPYDRRRVAEMVAALGELDDAPPRALESTLPLLRELLATPAVGAYTIRQQGEAAHLDSLKAVGMGHSDREVKARLDAFFRNMGDRRGFWDPTRPAPSQQNRAVNLPCGTWCGGDGPQQVEHRLRPVASRYGVKHAALPEVAHTMWELESVLRTLGLRAHDQLRILICEAGELLAWVGAFQPEPFQPRQELLLEHLAGPLRRRLIVERCLGDTELGHAAMEHIAAPAFVVNAAGRATHANEPGRRRLDRHGRETRAALAQAVRGGRRPGDVAVTKLTGAGMPPRFLVVWRGHEARVCAAIERARGAWGLTPREVEVAAELAAGRANHEIAHELGMAASTVELHVSAILRKASVRARSQVVVKLWELSGGG